SPRQRGFFRSILGSLSGGRVFSGGPAAREQKERERAEQRLLEREQQAANALLFSELDAARSGASAAATAAAAAAVPRAQGHPGPTAGAGAGPSPPAPVLSQRPGGSDLDVATYQSILGAAASTDPSRPLGG